MYYNICNIFILRGNIFNIYLIYIFIMQNIFILIGDEEYKNKWKGEDEKKLRDFLRRKEIIVCYVRGIIVGCGGVGKIIFFKRLVNVNYNVFKKIKLICYVDVYVNKFVLIKEGKMILSNFF